MQYLELKWRNASEMADLRQEVYIRAYTAALKAIPERTKQFIFAIARNLLIDRARHEQVVPIEAPGDIESLDTAADAPGSDGIVGARAAPFAI